MWTHSNWSDIITPICYQHQNIGEKKKKWSYPMLIDSVKGEGKSSNHKNVQTKLKFERIIFRLRLLLLWLLPSLFLSLLFCRFLPTGHTRNCEYLICELKICQGTEFIMEWAGAYNPPFPPNHLINSTKKNTMQIELLRLVLFSITPRSL